jgi:chorismate mutase/prephenate dehydratase
MDLTTLRQEIDAIDDELVSLFARRMGIVRQVGDYKRERNLAVLDAKREAEITEKATARVEGDIKGEAGMMMRSVIALSRAYQMRSLIAGNDPLLPPPEEPLATGIRAVYSGVSGAWGEAATEKLFPKGIGSPPPAPPSGRGEQTIHIGVEHFQDVFTLVRKGEADYGVVPIQNSRTGAIGETYDLLRKFGCYITAHTQLDIKQCLLGQKGAGMRDIREVYSHPEGFSQCGRFLADKSWDLIPTSNTAVAAKKAAESGSAKIAAIGSRYAAATYGLEVLVPDIMDSANNRTTFACIRGRPEYDAGCRFIALTFSAAHRSGSLCEALLPFYAAGINLTRIESRPSSSPESYRFFIEIAGNILDPVVIQTLRQLEAATAYMEVCGCYNYV